MSTSCRNKHIFALLAAVFLLLNLASINNSMAATQEPQSGEIEVESQMDVDASRQQEATAGVPIISQETVADAAGNGPGFLFHLVSYLIPLMGILGLAFTYWKSTWVSAQGNIVF